MKKIIALVLAACMLLACCSAVAEAPEGYPEVIEGLDFGGATVYLYDWWSNGERNANPSEEEALTYEYRDWLEATYNVKIVELALSDWEGNITELANMVGNKEESAKTLCLVGLASDFAGAALANDLFMPWTIDMSSDKWNGIALEFCTKADGQIYGVSTGKNEPRSCIFFNKRVLTEAGIDYETIYDAQANGTWTWDMLLDLMQQVQKDVDNDGIIDIYGMTGSNDDLALGLVFSNGGSFFGYDEAGNLVVTAGNQETLDALEMFQTIENTYIAPTPEGANWDWFKDFWEQGTTGFYAGQTWQGYNPNAEMADMADEWGAVMFPKGPNAETYKAMVCPNIFGVPNVYDQETAEKLMKLYDLYTMDTPGVDTEDGWIGEKYSYTDERAVDETYAMMREDEHACVNTVYLVGSVNNVLGSAFLWGPIWSMTPAEAVESATPVWQDMINALSK